MPKVGKTPEEVREYQRKYQNMRYHTDPEFRKRKLECNNRYLTPERRAELNKKSLEKYHLTKPQKVKKGYDMIDVIYYIDYGKNKNPYGIKKSEAISRFLGDIPQGKYFDIHIVSKIINSSVSGANQRLVHGDYPVKHVGKNLWQKL